MLDVGARDDFRDAILRHSEERWRDAMLAAAVLAVGGPDIGGLWLTARSSGARETFLAHLAALAADRAIMRIPAGVTVGILSGRPDIPRSMAEGRLVWDSGILVAADGGFLLVPMAERLDAGAAAVIADAMDRQSCPVPRTGAGGQHDDTRVPARFAVIALDETAGPDEALPSALSDRLGLHVMLDGVALETITLMPAQKSTESAGHWRSVDVDEALVEQLLMIAAAAGHLSPRASLHLLKVTRILAALDGRSTALPEHGLSALRLCLGVRLMEGATEQAPAEPAECKQEPPPAARQPDTAEASDAGDEPLASLDSMSELLAAVERGVVDGLSLATTDRAARQARRSGKAGAKARNARRGRPFASSRRPPFPDARPDIVETLRAAAPWQRLRARLKVDRLEQSEAPDAVAPKLHIRKDDFRFRRLRHRQPSTAIFVVDASGSTALERLGETKGAIEQLLANCYVRRDEVSLISFRGKSAELLMAPTRSLVAAKRKLQALPGGGPTPLASGLKLGLEQALAARRHGSTPVVVVMTDGSGNIALDGSADRALAGRETETIAGLYRANGLKSICIDVSRRPREAVTSLAGLLGADLHLLRQADAARMSAIVQASMAGAPS